MSRIFCSGAISEPWLETDPLAISFYRSIRELEENDYEHLISQIAANVGFSYNEVDIAIQHAIFNEYELNDGRHERFDEDIYIAASIQRLYNGSYYDADIVLLQHEYLESSIVATRQISVGEAHLIAQDEYDYEDSIFGMGLSDDVLIREAVSGKIEL